MKKKNGFTLIELLAIIVILGIIMAIVIPLVSHLIVKSKIDTAVVSGEVYIDTINTAFIEQKELATEGIYDVSYFENKIIDIDGNKPSTGTITIDNEGSVVSANLCINNILVNYSNKTSSSTGVNCNTINRLYPNGTIVYFNPVTGHKCAASEAVSTIGTKKGCMKWYAFNDSGASANTINLLLDHNTTGLEEWNSTGSNISGPTTIMTQLKNDTSAWVGVPTRTDSYSVSNGTATYTINYSTYKARLISAQEIAMITGNDIFKSETSTDTNWFYFDSNNQTQIANSIGKSNYKWLFDYTVDCTNYGCDVSDAGTYGYWTSTAVSGNINSSWRISRYGYLKSKNVDDIIHYGIRPVITLSKLIIE